MHFQRLWLRALELLEQYMRFPDSELLQEGPALTFTRTLALALAQTLALALTLTRRRCPRR